jgi:TolB-like protein/DNA-binding winged helix-turn-helix (wHTH) protein/tetratricopeptide (TPR) repeat protein
VLALRRLYSCPVLGAAIFQRFAGEELLLVAPITVYRFGEFLLDAGSGELTRNGTKIRLQRQPLQILLALISRPGQVLSRDELRASLWSGDTNVEFDDGLNHAVRRLRDMLGDTAQVPRYIETIPRRGYRFIAGVEGTPAEAAPETSVPPTASSTVRRRWVLVGVVVALLVVVCTAVLMHRHPAARIDSLAVLPLATFSSGTDDDSFADGVTEELTTELARIKSLRVISRTSAMRTKGSKRSLQEIARELGVDAVIEGSVQRAGDRVRISVQLVNVTNERHLWAETYERRLLDVLSVRTDVSREIAARVRHEVAPELDAAIPKNTVRPEAYDAYLIGTRLASRGDKEGFEKSIRYFGDAIRIDPSFALAYAELGESHGMLAYMAGERGEHFTKAIAVSRTAFELDPALPEAQIGTADLRFYWEWDWSQCEGAFRKAADTYPNSAPVQYHYGLCLFVLGRYDDAVPPLERARRVDPLSPLVNRVLGRLLGVVGRHQEALDLVLKSRDMEPDSPAAYYQLAWLYGRSGKQAESVDAYITARRLSGDSAAQVKALSDAFRSGGILGFTDERRAMVKHQLNALLAKPKATVRPLTLAGLYAEIGDTDEAFRYLNRAYDERAPMLTWIKSGQAWEALHNDPRFHTLVRRMGLPQ